MVERVPRRWPLSSPCRRRRWPKGQALQGPKRPWLQSPPADRWAAIQDLALARSLLPGRSITHSKFNRARNELVENQSPWRQLTKCVLGGRQPRDAGLSWANLSGANLNGAGLYGANLSGANLSGPTSSLQNFMRDASLILVNLDAT